MRCLSLIISKHLEKCLFSHLKDESRVSTAITIVEGVPRTFSQTPNLVFLAMNSFLWDVEKCSQRYNMRVHYSKDKSGGRLTGLFTDTGIVVMLEPSNDEVFERNLLLIKEISDRFCELNCEVITEIFTSFVDVI